MKIFEISPSKLESEAIQKASEILKIGGIVVYPTETLYALGANALDSQALQRVFEIKTRDPNKPISIAFKDLDSAKKFVYFNSTAEKLAEKFLPGPLTLILPAKVTFEQFLGGDKIGIRIPDHPVAKALLEEVKFPLTATSANISGKEVSGDVKDAINQVGDKVDLILDAGKCKYDKPSTVVDVSFGNIEILREGVISKEEIFS